MLFKESRFTMAGIGSMLCYFQYSFMEPILALRLSGYFELNTIQVGQFFIILPIFYIASAVTAGFKPEWIENRVLMIICSLATGIAYFLAGPSRLLGIEANLGIMGVGMALIGTFNPPLIVGGMPEMVNTIIEKYPN
jgi:hypothetical protein